jgi:hypothetical protein
LKSDPYPFCFEQELELNLILFVFCRNLREMLPLFVSHWNLAAEDGILAGAQMPSEAGSMACPEMDPCRGAQTPSTGEEDQMDQMVQMDQMDQMDEVKLGMSAANPAMPPAWTPVVLMMGNLQMFPSQGFGGCGCGRFAFFLPHCNGGFKLLWLCLCVRSYRVFWNLWLQIALEWL